MERSDALAAENGFARALNANAWSTEPTTQALIAPATVPSRAPAGRRAYAGPGGHQDPSGVAGYRLGDFVTTP